jgi:malate dehydrogenase (oxaloacetate-decarboxylating)(NADP+)
MRTIGKSSLMLDTSSSKEIRLKNQVLALLPPAVETLETQIKRCWNQLQDKSSDLERYLYLSQLRNSQVDLFYRIVISDVEVGNS